MYLRSTQRGSVRSARYQRPPATEGLRKYKGGPSKKRSKRRWVRYEDETQQRRRETPLVKESSLCKDE